MAKSLFAALAWLLFADRGWAASAGSKPPVDRSARELFLVGGSVISMVAGQPPAKATLVLRAGRIGEIGTGITVPAGAETIDVSGRYLLPGLTDMHAHVAFLHDPSNPSEPGFDRQISESVLKRLLAYGVTTVRNPAAPPAEGVKLRDDIAAHLAVGPRIFTAGWPLNKRSASAAEIRAEVDRQCDFGVDYIKLYANLTSDQTAVAIDQAHRRGVKVIGHLQNTDWKTAAGQGIDFLTHGVGWSASLLPAARRAAYLAEVKKGGSIRARILWLEAVDPNGVEMADLIRALNQQRISVDPTLVAYETKFLVLKKYRGASAVSRAPEALQHTWVEDDLTRDWTANDFARMQRVWPKMLAIVNRYFREGVLLTTGSDLPNRFVVPGISLYQEMELLHEAGLPNEAVLAAATRNAAMALGHADDSGTIEVGKRADLIVLDQNPLADIRNVRTVKVVIADGRVYRPEELLADAGP